MNRFKNTVYALLNPIESRLSAAKHVSVFLLTLISLNVLAVILETIEPIALKYDTLFYYFEFFSVIIFSIEYLCIEIIRDLFP